MFVIEYLCTEKSIESGISWSDTVGINWGIQSLPFTGLDDFFCSLFFLHIVIIFRESGCNILQDVTIGITIAHIITKIFDLPVSSIFLDMIVEPSE